MSSLAISSSAASLNEKYSHLNFQSSSEKYVHTTSHIRLHSIQQLLNEKYARNISYSITTPICNYNSYIINKKRKKAKRSNPAAGHLSIL